MHKCIAEAWITERKSSGKTGHVQILTIFELLLRGIALIHATNAQRRRRRENGDWTFDGRMLIFLFLPRALFYFNICIKHQRLFRLNPPNCLGKSFTNVCFPLKCSCQVSNPFLNRSVRCLLLFIVSYNLVYNLFSINTINADSVQFIFICADYFCYYRVVTHLVSISRHWHFVNVVTFDIQL